MRRSIEEVFAEVVRIDKAGDKFGAEAALHVGLAELGYKPSGRVEYIGNGKVVVPLKKLDGSE